MDNIIDLKQLSQNIVQTTAALLSVEQHNFDISDEDLVFVDDDNIHHNTKSIFFLRIAKPLYGISGDTIVSDRGFQNAKL